MPQGIFDTHAPRRFLISLSAALVLPAAAVAGDLDGTWTPPPVGTKIVWESGLEREVVGIDGNWILFKGDRTSRLRNAEWRNYMGLFSDLGISGKKLSFDEKAVAKLFPLEAGKKTTFYSRGKWNVRNSFKVVGIEEIETPIGARKTFVINHTLSDNDGYYYSKNAYYFDPALGMVLAGSWHVIKGRNSGSKGEFRIKRLELP